MKAVFKYGLNDAEIESIMQYCNSVDYCSIEQSLGWTKMLYNSKICYFLLHDETGIKSFSQITERLGSAQILYGPVCCEKEAMVNSINEIVKYYKKRGFYYLGIHLYYKSGYDVDYIEYSLNYLHNIKYVFDNENTKSSIEINLEKSLEEIYSKMRKGHKSDIKKAIRIGITVDSLKSIDDLNSFHDIYARMCKVNRIDESEFSSQNSKKIYNYLIENKKGQILLAKDKDNVILGGLILIYQGISVRYFKGAADPDKKDLPISHIILYEAIKRARNDNYKYFDFWGFNHFANKNDHVFYINHFKKGFGGYYTFFAKKMNINLIPKGYYIYITLLFVKNLFIKLHSLK